MGVISLRQPLFETSDIMRLKAPFLFVSISGRNLILQYITVTLSWRSFRIFSISLLVRCEEGEEESEAKRGEVHFYLEIDKGGGFSRRRRGVVHTGVGRVSRGRRGAGG